MARSPRRSSPRRPAMRAGCTLTIALELLEIIVLSYENSEPWHIVRQLLLTRLEFSYLSMQMIVGGLIPLILLAIVVLMNRYLHDRVRNMLTTVAALLCLLQVFSMRWNIVIGGQLLSKSFRGLRSPYEPEVYGREGILMAIVLVIIPFVILWVFDRLVGIDEEAAESAPAGSAGEGRVAGSAVPH